MRAPWIVVAFLAWAAFASAPATAQGPCGSVQWEEGRVRGSVEPVDDEYVAWVRFRTQPGCGIQAACPGNGTQARFELANAPGYLAGTIAPNPAPINSTAPIPGGGRETSTQVRFRLNASAPYNEAFVVQVRATCDGVSTTTSRTLRVGAHGDVRAQVAGAVGGLESINWTLRLMNVGNVQAAVDVRPSPDDPDDELDWEVPTRLVLDPLGAGNLPPMQDVHVMVRGVGLARDYSASITVSSTGARPQVYDEFELPLPFAVFEGESTPAPGVVDVLVLAGLMLRRQRSA